MSTSCSSVEQRAYPTLVPFHGGYCSAYGAVTETKRGTPLRNSLASSDARLQRCSGGGSPNGTPARTSTHHPPPRPTISYLADGDTFVTGTSTYWWIRPGLNARRWGTAPRRGGRPRRGSPGRGPVVGLVGQRLQVAENLVQPRGVGACRRPRSRRRFASRSVASAATPGCGRRCRRARHSSGSRDVLPPMRLDRASNP
jgi:hypothetical protein